VVAFDNRLGAMRQEHCAAPTVRLPRAPFAVAVLMVLALAGAGPWWPRAAEAAGATKQVQIVDPLFNMVAYTLTIPANWNFQGTVLTGPGCDMDETNVAYRVWSDDLRYGVQRIPSVSWYTVQDPRTPLGQRCKKMDAMNATEYAQMVLPTLRPGYQLVATAEAPQSAGMVESNKKMEAALNANADRLHMAHAKYSSDAKQLRIEYLMGKDPEEEFLQVMEQISEVPKSTIVSKPGQILRTQWMVTRKTDAWIVAERAPKGQLDAAHAQLEAIRTSLRENPEWDQKVAAWMQDRTNASIKQSWAITNASLKASQAQHDAGIARGQAFIDNLHAQGDKRNAEFAQYEDSRSRHTADQVDYLLDRQYYVNPATGNKSTISTTYTNNWENGTGDKVLSNIQGFDPNGQVQGNWTQLEPIRH
jgi:hypothetical protein